MKTSLKLLINPEVKSAYFSEYIKVALEELRICLPEVETSHEKIGPLDFIKLECSEEELLTLGQLSFFWGAFKSQENALIPLEHEPKYFLSEKFVFGSKFKGKTNELLTKLLINVSRNLSANPKNPKILDPMCGRATTLMWAMRLGLESKGIEVDPKAPDDITQIAKKWNTVESAGLKFSKGFVGKKTKTAEGKFLEISSTHAKTKIITGHSTNANKLLNEEKFDCIISDIPYGVGHKSARGSRNPLEEIHTSIDGWKECLKPGGVITIAFNSYIPTKHDLIQCFKEHGFYPVDMDMSHRMSESIVRDVVSFKI